jgi:hypothetical protein
MIATDVEFCRRQEFPLEFSSAWDIPMLRNCRTRFVVNPSNRTIAQFKSVFGTDFNVVRWR